MKILAIRDDDLCFFTTPAQIDEVFAPVFARKVPVSFACVSHTVPQHKNLVFFSRDASPGYYPLADNAAIIGYLRPLIAQGLCDVMVHGYTHEYRQVNGVWLPECLWKPAQQLAKETREARDYLASLFQHEPRVFVPPSNSIGKAGVSAVAAAGLDLSALLTLRPNRPFSLSYAACYVKRWTFRLKHNHPYPFTLDFGRHRELLAYALYRASEAGNVMKYLDFCARRNAPFVITTHYWQLAEDANLMRALLNTLDAALNLGYQPSTVAHAIANGGPSSYAHSVH